MLVPAFIELVLITQAFMVPFQMTAQYVLPLFTYVGSTTQYCMSDTITVVHKSLIKTVSVSIFFIL